MRRARFCLYLYLALGALSCKQRDTDSLPAEPLSDLTTDEMLREQKRVEAGEIVGAPLVSPQLLLDARGISVNGRLVATLTSIDASRLARVTELARWLSGLREHWKVVHPAQSFEGKIDLQVDPETPTFVVASTLVTAAYAGFPSQTVRTKGILWEGRVEVPGPPRELDDTEVTSEVDIRLARSATGYSISILRTGLCGRRAAVLQRVVPSHQLGEILVDRCQGLEPCRLSLEASAERFETMAALAAPALGRAPRVVDFRFFSAADPVFPLPPTALREGGSPAPGGSPAVLAPWLRNRADVEMFGLPPAAGSAIPSRVARPRGKPRGPEARLGSPSVNGRMPPEVIRSIFAASLDPFRACYEEGLTRDSALVGRVSVKLEIDALGRVAEACDGGTDLPDEKVAGCVIREVQKLVFPPPQAGSVRVIYPIMFSPP